MNQNDILEYFKSIEIDYSWSFSNLKNTDTSYISHGYYTYPAKFIPQLSERLILENSKVGDIVFDPFAGSFTTVVESVKLGRIGIGNDINELSLLLGKVKSTPLDPDLLIVETDKFKTKLDENVSNSKSKKVENERIDFWFDDVQKEKLGHLLQTISETENSDIRNFFIICFSQILKTCSIWTQKSVKPVRDFKKKKHDPYVTFFKQLKKMSKLNQDFHNLMNKEGKLEISSIILNQDSKNLFNLANDSIDLIITSPPYVTSYEYADLHQLPLLWLEYMSTVASHRLKFIGSSQRTSNDNKLFHSKIGDNIVKSLGPQKKSSEVLKYFQDMYDVFSEMYRILRKDGKFCIVIGNTEYKQVKILNAEVYVEQLLNIGFSLVNVVKREIPSKMLPSTRDNSGKFTKSDNKDKKLIYPTEYIITVQK